jgi:hypothetical protein
MLTDAERQRAYKARKYAEWDALPKIPCACGCGTLIAPINRQGKPAKFAHGHNRDFIPGFDRTGTHSWNAGKKCPEISARQKGKKKPPETVQKLIEKHRERRESGQPYKRGWKHKPETIAKMTESVRKRGMAGSGNPFYGKKHSAETIAKIAANHTGPLNAGWAGGASVLPYGPEFTRAYKRQIRERDGHTCQRCGKKQSDHWRTLEIHHIDHDKQNNHPDNLTTVCGSCNVWLSYHRHDPFTPNNRK